MYSLPGPPPQTADLLFVQWLVGVFGQFRDQRQQPLPVVLAVHEQWQEPLQALGPGLLGRVAQPAGQGVDGALVGPWGLQSRPQEPGEFRGLGGPDGGEGQHQRPVAVSLQVVVLVPEIDHADGGQEERALQAEVLLGPAFVGQPGADPARSPAVGVGAGEVGDLDGRVGP